VRLVATPSVGIPHFIKAAIVAAACLCSLSLSPLSIAAKLTAEQNLIVDCLLPGKVRQLGINRTYVSRKTPTKTSAIDCEIRGGDYVKLDRASLASSLNVWQQAASQGDPEAQYFVGEIFEKGVEQNPDYQLAITWYQRAAQQGFEPALISLGRLHEAGLGVPKDLVKAMNFYRQAAGLNEEEIAFASVFERLKEQDELRIAELKVQVAQQRRRAESIQRQSQVLQSDLDRARNNVKQLKQELKQLEQQLDTAKEDAREQLRETLLRKQEILEEELQLEIAIAKNYKETNSKLAEASSQLKKIEYDGRPEVVLKWPQFTETDAGFISEVPVGTIVNVVGAITDFPAVDKITINGEPYELDANGLFLKTLNVGSEAVILEVEVFYDEQQLAKTITIQPSEDLELILAGGGALTSKKLNMGNYHALVIGNNSYSLERGWEPLDTAVNDAKAMAKLLEEEYGFEVRLVIDADRDVMLTELEEMRRKLNSKDNLLVYYAGHGLVDPENDQGYWVPVDGSSDSAIRWVSNASITDQIRAMTARNVMVIADSCYSGSLMRSGLVTLRSGLTPEKKAQRLQDDVEQVTRVALSSGGLQPVIDSIENDSHSVFATALLSVLKNNNGLLDADSLATQVAHSVALATKDTVKQVPRFAPLAAGGHQGGEFYFRRVK